MPSIFSSRRKSEANLRSSASSSNAPPVPSTPNKLTKGANPSQGFRGSAAAVGRSRSASRAGAAARPERERASPPTTAAHKNSNGGGGEWVVLDGPAMAPRKDSGGGGETPIAARFARRTSSTSGYATPPRRDASYTSFASTVSSSSGPFGLVSSASSPANASVAHLGLTSSPAFYASTPPTSDGGHDEAFSLDSTAAAFSSPKQVQTSTSFGGHQREVMPRNGSNGISQTFASPASSCLHSPPSSGPATPWKHSQPNYGATAHSAGVGLPPSSSFFTFAGVASPVGSPIVGRTSASRARRVREASVPISEEEEEREESPLRRRGMNRSEGYQQGAFSRPVAETSELDPSFSAPSPVEKTSSRPSLPPGAAPPISALSNGFIAPRPPLSLSSTGAPPPPPKPTYNALAAFFGTSSAPPPPTSDTISPALSGTSSSAFSHPLLGAFSSPSPSASDEEGSPATPATSDDDAEEDEDENPTPGDEKPLPAVLDSLAGGMGKKGLMLDAPFELRPSPAVATREEDVPTPTQAAFPRSAPVQPQTKPVEVEKAATSQLPTRLNGSRIPPPPPLNAVRAQARARKASLPPPRSPTSPVSAASSGSRYSAAESSAAAVPQQQPISPAAAGVNQTQEPVEVPRPRTPPGLAPAAEQLAALPAQAVSPPSARPRARTSSLQSRPTPIAAPLPPTSPTTPSSSARRPLTPKSPRAPPPAPLDLSAVSPGRKRVTAEGTARTLAIKAARERREREASTGEEVAVAIEQAAPAEEEAAMEPEKAEEQAEDALPRPRVEYAFAVYTAPILRAVLPYIGFADLVVLRQVSKTLRRALDVEGKELILERFLGGQGYRSLISSSHLSNSSPVVNAKTRFVPPSDMIQLDLRDLLAFRAALPLHLDTYASLAALYTSSPSTFSATNLKLARATTRAWNRVVLRLRAQSTLPSKAFAPPAFPDLAAAPQPVHKTGRAASLRVWVPTAAASAQYGGIGGGADGWMTDQEVVEAEREVWRSTGCWAQLRKGDVVTNVAIPAFGNVGKLMFDGRYLRDLAFEYDVVGHLPPWLNMLALSPSYYHNIVVSSSSNPVFYLSLAPFVASVRETIQLCNDRVNLSSPQGQHFVVKKFVYRAGIKIKPGQLIGTSAGVGGSGPGGIDVVHDDWSGALVLETDGTTEHATMLIARVASIEPTPWRILRDKCRPGKLWLRPVLDGETS
ncbi:hypothetical protein JCM8097_002019 [Rhodosporidiobolus ruineniae]